MVKLLKLTFVVIALGFCSFKFIEKKNEGIEFYQGTLKEAKGLALTQNKLIFVDAYASWCGPCKTMSKRVFTQKEAGDYFNEHFVNLKIDMEKGEGPSLARKFNIRAYPTLIILDRQGQIINYIVGYQNIDDLLNFARSVNVNQN